MQFNYSYNNNTSVSSDASKTGMLFSPDLKREPTYFIGELNKNIEFREAISALHNVVISDLRYKPKDRTEYLEWVAANEAEFLKDVSFMKDQTKKQLEQVSEEIKELNNRRIKRWEKFNTEKKKYFSYLYKRDYDAWFVLDPVITVHPDEVFFECFSQDESSYGRLSVSYDVYKNINEFSCGTTNIDYSAQLYNEFQKIRSYKTTQFKIDPSGFEVQTQNEESYKEVKIDLPDTWVRGFLQVNSAMCMPMISFDLTPMDIHNLCFILRRHKEIKGPRSIRFMLVPGEPVKAIFDPWNYKVVCDRSIYKGPKKQEIRIWGRRRLHILERLIPISKKFTVHLLGTGMPSFYIADLGDMSFTLGLSGWTANDWSTAGNIDLLAPRKDTDTFTKKTVFNSLKEKLFEKTQSLSKRLNLDKVTVLSALSSYAQAGRVIYDLNKSVYRIRELTKEPLSSEALRFSNPREKRAYDFVERDSVQIKKIQKDDHNNTIIKGIVRDKSRMLDVEVVNDNDDRIIRGSCQCSFYFKNKMFKGPCEHIIALKIKNKNSK